MNDVSSASGIVRFGMAGIAVALAILFCVGVSLATRAVGQRAAQRRRWTALAVIGTVAWMGLTATAARSGWLAQFERRPPPLMFLVLGVVTIGLAVGATRVGAVLAAGLPTAALVGLQAFRLPLELVMHQAAREHIMPSQMSYSGYNFDIVTGITAIVVAVLAHQRRAPRWLLVGWNLLGSALLLIIVAIALAATPLFHAFGPENLNTFVSHSPYVWLPAVMVATAFAGHLVIYRHLRARGRSVTP
jgi:hypothetical protein